MQIILRKVLYKHTKPHTYIHLVVAYHQVTLHTYNHTYTVPAWHAIIISTWKIYTVCMYVCVYRTALARAVVCFANSFSSSFLSCIQDKFNNPYNTTRRTVVGYPPRYMIVYITEKLLTSLFSSCLSPLLPTLF